jgi:hypothetical protein
MPSLTQSLPEITMVVAAIVVSGIVFVWWSQGTEALEYAIGGAGALAFVQVGHVHLFTALCGVYFVFGARKVRARGAQATLLVLAVGILALSVPLSSGVPNPTLVLQLLALAASAAVIAMKANADSRLRMLRGFVVVSAVGALVALGQKIGMVPYTPVVDSSGVSRPPSFDREPDWLGMFCAASLIILVRVEMRFSRVLSALLCIGLLLAMARAAILGLIVVGALMLVVDRIWPSDRNDVRRPRRRRRILIGTAAAALLVLAVSGATRNAFISRINGAIYPNQNNPSVIARQEQQRGLEALQARAPWHGLGLSAEGLVGVNGALVSADRSSAVASNWILGWWVDGKYLAMPLILFLVGLALRDIRGPGGALLGVVLINSLFSNAMFFPITWLAIGIVISELRPAYVLRTRSSARRARAGASYSSPRATKVTLT